MSIREVVVVDRTELARIIRSYTGGRIFGVKFVKRTDGSIRTMTCRKSTHVGRSNGQMRYNPTDYNLIAGVYDVRKQGYRSINIDGLISAQIDGFKFITQ